MKFFEEVFVEIKIKIKDVVCKIKIELFKYRIIGIKINFVFVMNVVSYYVFKIRFIVWIIVKRIMM